MIENNLEPEVYSLSYLQALDQYLKQHIQSLSIHLNLNSGMNRLGIDSFDDDEIIEILKDNKRLYVKSIFSHLASSEMASDDEKTLTQIKHYHARYVKINHAIGYQPMRHILNTSGIHRFPQAQFEMVRLGIGMYGIEGSGEVKEHLEKAHRLKARILQIRQVKSGEGIGYNFKSTTQKKSRLATVGIGYADGLMRATGNGNHHFLVKGEKAATIGNISMDMTIIDITGIQGVHEGDEVEVFGPENPIEALAKACNSISYEILSRISSRVRRVFYQE